MSFNRSSILIESAFEFSTGASTSCSAVASVVVIDSTKSSSVDTSCVVCLIFSTALGLTLVVALGLTTSGSVLGVDAISAIAVSSTSSLTACRQ